MKKIERALISVSDKEGILEFARELKDLGVEIISTGGTARALKNAGIDVTYVSDYTGFPEIMEGRVKTLHPKIHGGLLGLRDNPIHLKDMQQNDIKPIDMVVVNLYPFEETIAKPGVTRAEAIENIDIGGPSMLRSAAKNYQDVIVIVNPIHYSQIIKQIKENGNVSAETRLELAYEVFRTTSYYDSVIQMYLHDQAKHKPATSHQKINLEYLKVADLRYGENPHQKASFYREKVISAPCASVAEQLHGKELSFNNYLDLDAAIETIKEFSQPAAVVIKHTNPCGVAIGDTLLEAYRRAHSTDPVSAFGSVVSFNRAVDVNLAQVLNETFIEAIVAPSYNADALDILKQKKDRRLMLLEALETWVSVGGTSVDNDIKRIGGGILIQQADRKMITPQEVKCVTERRPTDQEMQALMFAWKVVKHVKSNAIVYTNAVETIGIGAGQMSRVDSSELAISKSKKDLKGSVLASDAFFPFRDAVDAAVKAGAIAIIQPGGSVRDEESIQACNENNIAMVFTGIRHFRH